MTNMAVIFSLKAPPQGGLGGYEVKKNTPLAIIPPPQVVCPQKESLLGGKG
jgi:hypothetical protein